MTSEVVVVEQKIVNNCVWGGGQNNCLSTSNAVCGRSVSVMAATGGRLWYREDTHKKTLNPVKISKITKLSRCQSRAQRL